MGIEQARVPTLGTKPTFEPSGLKMVKDQAQKMLHNKKEINYAIQKQGSNA